MALQLLTVAAAEADTRLDRWLRRRVPHLTQGALQKLLRTGQIRVDGRRAEASDRLAAGAEVRIPPVPETSTRMRTARPAVDARDAKALERLVLFSDRSVIVLDKPQGLAVQGGPGVTKHLDGMLDALQFEAEERPRLVHRLDRDTSGVLILGRTAAAAAALARAFRERGVTKTYWAITVGQPDPPAGRIDLSLLRERSERGERTIATDDPRLGTRAITDFRTVDAVRKRAAWLELQPVTGRTHQLRVHCLEALGCPILGDGKYGGAAAMLEPLAQTLHLHARALTLPHPDGGTLEAAAPIPAHMRESFDFLGFEIPKTLPPRRLA